MAVHPSYGDLYSFPWKRGPNEAISEYNEALSTFDQVRNTVYASLNEFDWPSRFVILYSSEEAATGKAVMVAVLRVFLQMLRTKRDTAELIINHPQSIQMLHHAIASKDTVLTALGLMIMTLLITNQERIQSDLKIDPIKMCEIFEKNVNVSNWWA